MGGGFGGACEYYLNGTESHVELNRELRVVVMLSDRAVSS